MIELRWKEKEVEHHGRVGEIITETYKVLEFRVAEGPWQEIPTVGVNE